MSQRVGCLVIHGFSRDVTDILPLAKTLREDGYQVECPTLEGHGATRRQLAKSTRHDWLRSVDEAYKRLAKRADKIVIIGFSMGGLLAFHLTAVYPVELVITMNAPYKYWNVRQAMRYLRDDFTTHARRYLQGIGRIPFRSAIQFRLLLSETKSLLPHISVPCVLLQSKLDDTTHAVSAELFAERIQKAETVQINWYERSNHLLLFGPEKEAAIEDIRKTIKTYCLC
ncbi:alpha/beta hydrolase [Brevibacillus sp. TJ4]|uniref:alpha/beta hydrolase n=1 Tax=Brevibacillus sp. TJ4 TaxID=3234853 RepID=UPI0037D63512